MMKRIKLIVLMLTLIAAAVSAILWSIEDKRAEVMYSGATLLYDAGSQSIQRNIK